MRFSLRYLKLVLACLPAVALTAQGQGVAAAKSATIQAIFISDIHFDPLSDPAKAKELAAAPVIEWREILAGPASANQARDFAALQGGCHARGVDTPFALLESSLQAMHASETNAKFITVTGDLVVHALPCRFKALMPGATPAEYQAFVLKTIDFVMSELERTFPGVPVYATLGNNDSGCGDYQLDAGSEFLAAAGKSLTRSLPAALAKTAEGEFAAEGNFSVKMAEPMKGTRLISIDDLFLSARYRSCGGKADEAAPAAEIQWLEQELTAARKAGEKVWVIGHIPPGIDPYSTLTKLRNVCAGEEPVMFLSSDALARTLSAYADVVRLALFAHTHMDELRLIPGEARGAVPLKMVASISPVNGNNPSFTVAEVNPATAELVNYQVITASNQTGVSTTWSEEYDYAKSFKAAAFAAADLTRIIDGFKADRGASSAVRQAYLRHYFVGDRSAELGLFWPQYVCSLSNMNAKSYAGCLCGDAKQGAAPTAP